jgi:predicted aspartyl protease
MPFVSDLNEILRFNDMYQYSDYNNIDAMFDSGFSYWLAVDSQDVSAFNWVFIRRQIMETARGNFRFNIYAGKIKLDGQEYNIPVHVGKGLSEVLLGRQWLTTRKLLVDMANRLLTLG